MGKRKKQLTIDYKPAKKKKPHGPDNFKFGTVSIRWRSDRERKAVEAAAKKTGFTRSAWARMVIVEFLGLPDDAS